MYAQMITNENGEPLGTEYFYDDEPADVSDGSPFDHYADLYGDDYDGYVEPPNCPGHATADETSGDASQQSDGSWVCDIGPCPTESVSEVTAYQSPPGRRPEPLPAVRVGMDVTDESGIAFRVVHIVGPIIIGEPFDSNDSDYVHPGNEIHRLIGHVFPINRPDLPNYRSNGE